MGKLLSVVASFIFVGLALAQECVVPGADLQAVLDSGKDLVLKKGHVYGVKNTLRYKTPGQKIYTADAKHILEYATLRIERPDLLTIIDAGGIDGAVLQNVRVDGNRYTLSAPTKEADDGQPPLMFFGAARDQSILHNLLMNTRTWSTLKIHEGDRCEGIVAEGNIIIGAGVGPRGNGRDLNERGFNWGDGISCAAQKSIIRNNLIIDPTDVGIVLYGAPGSVVEDNVVACISRESLGGINLVDPIYCYALNDEKTRFDYGVVVRNNLVDAFGGRVHMGFAMGAPPWAPKNIGTVLEGARVHGNTVSGGAGAYGFVANGVDGFQIYSNTSTAFYSGIGEGYDAQRPPDDPGPFLYDPKTVTNSRLQDEFIACSRHLVHLLRCNHGPTNALGYRVYPYEPAEAEAVVRAAYIEMLGRQADSEGLAAKSRWLQESKATADELRRDMMKSPEFKEKFGDIPTGELHPYRTRKWVTLMDKIQLDCLERDGKVPDAKTLYQKALTIMAGGPIATPAEPATLNGKIMCGYQGWYRCPGDRSGLAWVHYRGQRSMYFWPGECGIDYWPDMTELDKDETYKTPFKHKNGENAYVYSSMNAKTVSRHFRWMKDYGIDGAVVQRFLMEVQNDDDEEAILSGKSFNHVLALARDAANQHGRTYYVMYDLTAIRPNYIERAITDWKFLVDSMRITRDPDDRAYQKHEGKPVVGIWGMGFQHINLSPEECERFIDFLKNDPKYGGNTIMLGVPLGWRTLDRGQRDGERWHAVWAKADIISPWTVGQPTDANAVRQQLDNDWRPDQAWCRERDMDYMPVVFPGFCWKNLKKGQDAADHFIDRRGGQFLWEQYVAAKDLGTPMVYQAMFDEMDEGTQIFKVTNDPPDGKSGFKTYGSLPSDHYLWLVGEAGRMMRGERPKTTEMPVR
jgi:hypothetical protein